MGVQRNIPGAIEVYVAVQATDRLEACGHECLARGSLTWALQAFSVAGLQPPAHAVLAAATLALNQGRISEAHAGYTAIDRSLPRKELLDQARSLWEQIELNRVSGDSAELRRILNAAIAALTAAGTIPTKDRLLQLAVACWQNGGKDWARDILLRAEGYPGNNTTDKTRLADCGYAALRQHDLASEAQSFFLAAEHDIPVEEFRQVGMRLVKQARYSEAVFAFEVAHTAMSPADVLEWAKRSLRAGNVLEARNLFELAGAKPAPQDLLEGGDASMRNGDAVQAILAFELAGSEVAQERAIDWGNWSLEQNAPYWAQKWFAFAGVTPSDDPQLSEKCVKLGHVCLDTFARDGDRQRKREFDSD